MSTHKQKPSESAPSKSEKQLFQRVVRGGGWLIALRILTQIVTLIRTVILCRLILPLEFGLLGVATLTTGMMLSFSEMGFRQALIQRKNHTSGHLNVAWTLGILRGLVLFAVIYLSAPYVAAFFDRPESPLHVPEAIKVIRVVAFSLVLSSLINIGTVFFVKELEFHKQLVLETAGLLVDAAVAISLAFIYRNAWALVWGRLAGSFTRCVMSYMIHPYRPRLSIEGAKIKDLWGFGKHMLISTVMKFLCVHGDDAFLGRMLGAGALGLYQRAFHVGTLVANEIGNKISQVSFPAYSKVQDNHSKLKSGYLLALQATSLVVFPIAGGLIVLAHEFTEIVLGPNWLPMVTSMQILCLLGPLKCMQRGPVFMALGRPDIVSKLAALRLTVTVATIYPLTVKWQMAGTSLCVLLAAVSLQPIGFYQLKKLINVEIGAVLKLLSLPVGASLIMMLAVFYAKNALGTIRPLSLIFLICLGMVTYLISICLAGVVSKEYNALALIREILKGLK
ncbi:lipopolysaccharide biosynthesis protein [Planctomycetota bacterium]